MRRTRSEKKKMGNKWDLKTVLAKESLGQAGNTSAVTNIGGAIADGQKRFLTYIRVERKTALLSDNTNTGMEIAIASHTTKAAVGNLFVSIASTNIAKLILMTPVISALSGYIGGDGNLRNEIRGDVEHPILSVLGPGYMLLGISSAATATVFAEYFDE